MRLLFVLFVGVLFIFVGCKDSDQPPYQTPPQQRVIPPMINPITPKKIVVYDFWAPWCPPCRAFAPTFESWKHKYANDHTQFKKVNLDEEQDFAANFSISSIPTIIVTVDGVEVKRWVGAPRESEILQYLK